jgi:hypothetical protein
MGREIIYLYKKGKSIVNFPFFLFFVPTSSESQFPRSVKDEPSEKENEDDWNQIARGAEPLLEKNQYCSFFGIIQKQIIASQ